MKSSRLSLVPRLILIAGVVALAALFRTAPSEHRLVLALGSERAHLRHVQLECLDDAQHPAGGRWWFDASRPAPPELALEVHAVGRKSRCEIRLDTDARSTTEVRVLRLEGERLILRLERPVRELAQDQDAGPRD